MISRLTLISLATLTLLSPAATEEMPELSAAQIRNAIGHLESDHPANRAATYKACRERGDAFRATYRKMLYQARASHVRKFSTTVNTALGPRTAAWKMLEAWRAWENSSQLARESVQTNHNKEKSKLNEKLSNACRLHSQEMEWLGYFAHESPVEENKTFGMRARKAGFEGAIGECIYMGRREAAAAKQAWWYSCGHRVINYSSRPDTLGIGPHNSHWTLNTGSAR